jgi:hypothetical protein
MFSYQTDNIPEVFVKGDYSCFNLFLIYSLTGVGIAIRRGNRAADIK